MKYVTGYTGFSEDPELQEGNYIALKFANNSGATTTVELVGGTAGPATIGANLNWVGRITDPANEKIKVVTSIGTYQFTRIFSLTGLTLLTT